MINHTKRWTQQTRRWKICHELTDTPRKITRPKTVRSDLERTSLNGTHFENNLETYQKCQRSKALMETEQSGNFNTNQTEQPHQEMNATNQENEHMTYEIYKPIDPQLKKKRPTFKQSKHDYTIRSEWGAEAFEFWGWKRTQIRMINHTKRWTQQTRRWKIWQMQTPRNRGMITNRIKRIPTIGDTTRTAKTTTEHQRRWNTCQINNTNGTTDPTNLTQTTTHTTNHVVGMTKTSMIITTIDEKKNTNQNDQPHQEMNTTNQEMKNMSRTYRYTQENYTPKNRQKRSGKNKLEWNTFREQSRDVSEMSKIEGFDGNRTKWKF